MTSSKLVSWVDSPARKSVNQYGRLEDSERRLIKWDALQSHCEVGNKFRLKVTFLTSIFNKTKIMSILSICYDMKISLHIS